MTQEQLQQKAEAYADELFLPYDQLYGNSVAAYIQGYQDGQEGSAGAWVKASERLPITPEQVIVRWLYLGEYVRIDLVSAHQLDHWVKSQVDPDYYEWLDESTKSTPIREAAEAMYKALKELCELKTIKDTDGKTEDYQKRQPMAWGAAKQAIDNYEKLK